MKKGGVSSVMGKTKSVNPVAEDQNWRTNVTSELRAADRWPHEWGFLLHQDDCKPSLIICLAVPSSKDQLILRLELQLGNSRAKSLTRTNEAYGRGSSLEIFDRSGNNRCRALDLMPVPRRPIKKKP